MASSGAVRHRPRLVRGPVTIGEPAAWLEPRLAAAEPYRPDTIADGGEVLGLTVRAASVRGLTKRFAGGPRQDDLCLRSVEATETLLIAVADGISGAPRSELGAALAVRYATAAAARQLDAGTLDWVDVFQQAAWGLIEEHRRLTGDPDAGAEQAAAQLATTLVVAAITGSRVQVAAVGDSPALLLAAGRYTALVPEPERADGLIGGAVEALPRSVGGLRTAEGALSSGRGEVLLVCTDGLSLPLAGGEGEVGRLLARELRHPPDIIDFARLLDFSRATYDDDRTLVAVWPGDDPD